MDDKCKFPDGITIKPDGIHELDPCIYKETECYKNVTVHISKCIYCGHTDVRWSLQDNTEQVEVE